jgi:hypothetical protein
VFSTLAGMPQSTNVRRRRMTLAAADVVTDELPLLEVALRHGFATKGAVTTRHVRRRLATAASSPGTSAQAG